MIKQNLNCDITDIFHLNLLILLIPLFAVFNHLFFNYIFDIFFSLQSMFSMTGNKHDLKISIIVSKILSLGKQMIFQMIDHIFNR